MIAAHISPHNENRRTKNWNFNEFVSTTTQRFPIFPFKYIENDEPFWNSVSFFILYKTSQWECILIRFSLRQRQCNWFSKWVCVVMKTRDGDADNDNNNGNVIDSTIFGANNLVMLWHEMILTHKVLQHYFYSCSITYTHLILYIYVIIVQQVMRPMLLNNTIIISKWCKIKEKEILKVKRKKLLQIRK